MIDRTEDMIAKARVMAEEFAKVKTPKFLEAFLSDTMIAKEMKRLEKSEIEDDRFLNLLVNEYQHPFGQALSLAYAIGYMDRAQDAPVHLYREKSKPPQGESPCSLLKPGDV